MDDGRSPALRRSPTPWPADCDGLTGNWAEARIPPFPRQRAHGSGDLWLLEDFLELGALAGAVPCARLHTWHVLREWNLAHLCEGAEILVTELITNAVKASRAMTQAFSVRLWLMYDSAQVLIVVWDASQQPPARVDAGDEAEYGRGLMLVEAISAQWGWYSREDSDGKFVWAILEELSGDRLRLIARAQVLSWIFCRLCGSAASACSLSVPGAACAVPRAPAQCVSG